MTKKILIAICVLIIVVVLFGGCLQRPKPPTTMAECGNGICESRENGYSCPEDCCTSGDGLCREGCIPENDNDCEAEIPIIPAKVKVETICTDGIDNDGDGLIDNEDGDCWSREPVFMEDFDPLLTFEDLHGLLPSLKECGIKTVELMPVFEHCNSKKKGYRWMVRDYFKLDPARGDLADLENFLAGAHQMDMKVATTISPEDSTPPKLLRKSLLGEQGYDKEGKGGDAYRYQMEHLEKRILLRNAEEELASHPIGWGYAVDCSSEDVITLWEEIFKHIMGLGFDGLRLDSPAKNYCHQGETVYIRCQGYPCPDPVEGDHSSLDLYRRLKELLQPNQAFMSESPSLTEHQFKWLCDFPYYHPYTDLDEVAQVSEDYGFTPILLRMVLSAESPQNNKLKDALFKIVAPTKEEIRSEDLTEWINTQYSEHVLYNRERFRFVRNWNYLQFVIFRFISNDPRYLPAVTLTCTIRGVPKVTYYELFGHQWENLFFPGAKNPPSMRYEHWRKVLNIRSKSNALKYGSIENAWKSGDNTYAYLREYEDEKVIIVLNFLDKEATSTLDLSFLPEGAVLYDELNNEKFTVDNPENFKISVPGYGSRILILK